MKAMVLRGPGPQLELVERPTPSPGPEQVLIRVRACAVCRTDLHVVDRDLPDVPTPIIPGHEIVGEVISAGSDTDFQPGDRVGVPWLGHTCGRCDYCAGGQENLCGQARFTGYQIDGGFAEQTLADHRYCFRIDPGYSDVEAAPLLCAGLIGYRSLVMAGEARRLGIYGFGAAAHIVAQVAVWQNRKIYAFTRAGDTGAQEFARDLGAVWAGSSEEAP
ncbi:MAG: alcohol dehydrogenase catalytic domain-containing protein, partial [Gammaproteobacteria bacterium]